MFIVLKLGGQTMSTCGCRPDKKQKQSMSWMDNLFLGKTGQQGQVVRLLFM